MSAIVWDCPWQNCCDFGRLCAFYEHRGCGSPPVRRYTPKGALSRQLGELVTGLRSSVTVDWMRRDPARVPMRVLVKRILRKYGYPPDLQDAAVQTVLQQAEALSAEWAS